LRVINSNLPSLKKEDLNQITTWTMSKWTLKSQLESTGAEPVPLPSERIPYRTQHKNVKNVKNNSKLLFITTYTFFLPSHTYGNRVDFTQKNLVDFVLVRAQTWGGLRKKISKIFSHCNNLILKFLIKHNTM